MDYLRRLAARALDLVDVVPRLPSRFEAPQEPDDWRPGSDVDHDGQSAPSTEVARRPLAPPRPPADDGADQHRSAAASGRTAPPASSAGGPTADAAGEPPAVPRPAPSMVAAGAPTPHAPAGGRPPADEESGPRLARAEPGPGHGMPGSSRPMRPPAEHGGPVVRRVAGPTPDATEPPVPAGPAPEQVAGTGGGPDVPAEASVEHAARRPSVEAVVVVGAAPDDQAARPGPPAPHEPAKRLVRVEGGLSSTGTASHVSTGVGVPALASSEPPRHVEPGDTPVVQVTIGRVEVRATPSHPRDREPASSLPAIMSLEDYLQLRRRAAE